MYYPYFRGKQYELITVRETAPILAAANFVPIIEPVKEGLSGLQRALEGVCEQDGQAIVVVNPHHGVHAEGGKSISGLLQGTFADHPKIAAGVLLKKDMSVKNALACYNEHKGHTRVLIHGGFLDGKGLAEG